jgi:hypothetical protein
MPGRLTAGSTQDICLVPQTQARAFPAPHTGTAVMLSGLAPVALQEQVGGGVPAGGSAKANDAVKHAIAATGTLYLFICPSSS